MTDSPHRPQRLPLIDVLRGLAIVAMVIFHIGWDFYYFGIWTVDVTRDTGWVVFQKSILSSFLLLAGMGLVLAHGHHIRWWNFWRREAFLVAGALVTTAGTYWMFPEYFVFFGVLHAIALFSLLGLVLLRLPHWALLGLGAAWVAVSFTYTDPVFTSRELGWIGFWPVSPETSDVVPLFPWFGVFVLGMGAMRLLVASPAAMEVLGRPMEAPVWRILRWMGRWSLPIYLLHQPLMIGALNLVLLLQPTPPLVPDVPNPSLSFLQSCQRSCTEGGTDGAICINYCDCALEQVISGDLWDAVNAVTRTEEQEIEINAMARLCTAMTAVAQPPPQSRP
ncbi:DUF1624 domain-containing protein [Devosia sp.]|uniref:DUF1624 domain-containing protein n=1 Tax=Devosia sp. TaxID=1871048 RepID=UPI003A949679